MPSPEQRTDVVIIGAGPVGLFAIFECGMLGLKCHVVDALDVLGGQCSALYPEKPIYDVPGFPKIQAGELIERLREQAAPFAPVFHLGQRVEMLMAAEGDRWLAGTEAGTRINARAVVIAGGGGAFGPKRPPLPGIERFEGKSVFYAVQRRADHEGKRVVIVGGGDSAVDWALSLAEIAERVTVVHRRPKFRAAPDSAQRLKRLAADGAIDLVIPFQPVGLEGDDGRLTAVIVRSLDGEERRLEADVLLPFFGLAASLGPIAKWGLELERNHVKVDPATCLTNVPGIFAIGDIAVFPGKLKLILSGFAEAAMAAHAIYPLVHPDQELHFEYSTMTGVPGRG
jgi:thioredoxin reductase (NADPH)